MNQARGRSRSRSQPPAPISRDPKPWSSLFKAPVGSPDLRLDFFAPEVQADQKIAVYEAIDSDELIETWSMTIVGYVVGLRTSFFPLSSYIRTRWGISTFDLHMLETGFFVCRLYSEEDLQRVLEGFWTIRGHLMILRRWAPDVRLELDSLQSIPIWVSFHGLPLHLWGRRFIAKLCSTLGQPLYLDKATASQTRLTFARACVMVSSDEELPNDVSYHDLDGSTRKVKVSYSWKPQRCKVCLSFGHVNGACQQPSQKITQVYRPRQEPQNVVTTTNPSTDTPVPTVVMAEKMIEHSDSLGQRHEQEKDKSGLPSLPIISENFTAGASQGSHSPITTSPSRITPSDNQEISFQQPLGNQDIATHQTHRSSTHPAILDSLPQEDKQTGCQFNITGIYASNSMSDRNALWRDLVSIANSYPTVPWVVLGDFNTVRYTNEKVGGRVLSECQLQHFNDCIDTAALTDMKSVGDWFSWNNQSTAERKIMARLDRCLINQEWLAVFPDSLLEYGAKLFSDHSIMHIHADKALPRVKKPFRFFNMWSSHPKFLEVIKSAWDINVFGSPPYILCQKLKACKAALKKWNSTTFGNINDRVQLCKKELMAVQSELNLQPLDANLIYKEAAARNNFMQALKQEECFLKQKSRQHWLTLGDSNTKFFYAAIATRRATNRIKKCKGIDGNLIEDLDEVKNYTKQFFYSLLNQEQQPNSIHVGPTRRLDSEALSHLNAPITDDEIVKVVFKSPKHKSPGPDGFPAEFYQIAWAIVGNDVIKACRHFFSSGHILKDLNCTFISLVPKNDGADSLENYRPISLCNFIYKVISKLLADRLQKVMNKVISPNQAAFLKGRSIHHNVLLANDLVKDLHSKTRGKKICFKADLRKAFDSVNRDFIYMMLHNMGFPQHWVKWIQCCLETPKFSILFNGSPIGFFGSKNGIRQGDPLSPYLFTIAMEGLSCMLEEAVSNGKIKVPHYGSVYISHITFADDLIIFLRDDPVSVSNLADILNEFGKVSGLKLNHAKSKVYVGACIDNKDHIAQTLGVAEGNLPVPYLGLPLISTGINKASCQPIIQKIKNRIFSWKNRLLSKAGRLELIRSVLTSYSIYWSHAFLLPAGLLHDIDKLLMNFFWNGTDGKAMHMANWDSICKPKDEGGLNLRHIRDWNKACMVKQLWDILQNKSSLWSQWVFARYLTKESIWEVSAKTSHSAAWKGILKARRWLRNNISYVISSGTNINMWYDPWVNGKSIFQIFGDRVRQDLGAPKDWKVSEFINNGTWCLPNPTSPDMLLLWPTIRAITIKNNSSDMLIWLHDNGPSRQTSYDGQYAAKRWGAIFSTTLRDFRL
ncbi:hypothetical protein OPV22_005946 [Ensete ventricosum]|uniref:Reverse transcriptase domain-containing protein n=1 Tax=Ensete ventricosum TaxID=4639 RepID=A0AAV8RE02_ENSVE|nr:hypothetical protein OPV22_005946 [Ensete ventricosum]